MTTSEDIEWIRTRAAKLEADGMDYGDALVKACQEREKRLRQQGKKPKHPLRVSLGDLLKAKDEK